MTRENDSLLDMTNTLFLTTVAVEPTFVAFNRAVASMRQDEAVASS